MCIKLYLPSFNDLIQKEEIDTYAMEIIQNHPKIFMCIISFDSKLRRPRKTASIATII